MMDESRVFNPLDLQLSRSVYDWHPHDMGTCLAGRLIPSLFFNMLPGSEVKVGLKSLFKMSTPVYPTMDYLYADISFFFVPYKLVMSRRYGTPSVNDKYESFEGFIGAQDFLVNTPVPDDGIQLPVCNTNSGACPPGSLGNYLFGPDGFNVNPANPAPGVTIPATCFNALPLMSYYAIWNDNFREPNVQSPVTWNFVYSNTLGRYYLDPKSGPKICLADCEKASLGYTDSARLFITWAQFADIGKTLPLPTSVMHGYFGSLLPWPQRNLTGVELPLGGFAPLKTNSISSLSDLVSVGSTAPLISSGDSAVDTLTGLGTYPSVPNGAQALFTYQDSGGGSSASLIPALTSVKTNMGVDLSNATGVNVEALRALITKQHWYEDLARSGNRLDELEYGTFGVRPKDSGCNRPIYLGGKRIQLNVDMVASTNGGSTSSTGGQNTGSLGDLGAFSHTNDDDYYFHAGFDTWGCMMCVFTIRSCNLIAGGRDRMWTKAVRDDFYWPEFARLGNQSILCKEIQATYAVPTFSEYVLGYQEYAEEWRDPRDKVCGLLVPGQSLGFMTYAHRFQNTSFVSIAQVLDASKQFIDVDRTLAVGQATSGFQFIYQFTYNIQARIPVGKDSVPGVQRI